MNANITTSSPIKYSLGLDKYDNCPIQKEAANFDEFEKEILGYISPAKGKNYFTGPLSYGPHDDTNKYPEEGHYRLASHALPRRFLATDQDGYRDLTTFEKIGLTTSAIDTVGLL